MTASSRKFTHPHVTPVITHVRCPMCGHVQTLEEATVVDWESPLRPDGDGLSGSAKLMLVCTGCGQRANSMLAAVTS